MNQPVVEGADSFLLQGMVKHRAGIIDRISMDVPPVQEIALRNLGLKPELDFTGHLHCIMELSELDNVMNSFSRSNSN